MADAPPPATDPGAVLRSRRFVALLVLASIVGLIVSLLAWGFLELIHQIQQGLFTDLPNGLGFDEVPWWWPLPILVLAGIPVAYAVRLPGAGGHVPAEGLTMARTTPDMLFSVLLAAIASLGLGLVLGPEAPLIALGGGFTILMVSQLRKNAPQQMLMVLGAAGSFAAISMIFQSPVVAAVLVIEASGLGGPTLPVILLPGLLAAGIGSLTFIGICNWAALDTSAYSLAPLSLPSFASPTWGEVGWSIVLAAIAAGLVFVVRRIGLEGVKVAAKRPAVVLPVVGAVVAVLAIVFAQITDHGTEQVLFSGQDALPGLVAQSSTWSISALVLVILCKGLAWGVSLGTFRGGPTFPALYLGAAGGLLASHLPGLSITPAVAVGMAAMAAAMLRLPLSSVIIATALTIHSGAGSAPLIIVGAVTAYLVSLWLDRPPEERRAFRRASAEEQPAMTRELTTATSRRKPGGGYSKRRRRELMTPVSKPARCSPPWKRACSIFRQRFITTPRPASIARARRLVVAEAELHPQRPSPRRDGLLGHAGEGARAGGTRRRCRDRRGRLERGGYTWCPRISSAARVHEVDSEVGACGAGRSRRSSDERAGSATRRPVATDLGRWRMCEPLAARWLGTAATSARVIRPPSERAVEVASDVLDVLDADRDPDQVGADAHRDRSASSSSCWCVVDAGMDDECARRRRRWPGGCTSRPPR